MSKFFYSLFLNLYRVSIQVASPFNPKAAQWITGRRGLMKKLALDIAGKKNIIWFHCASLGEFEQGRPLIEKLKTRYPGFPILLTFFSPSGYEIRKNYKGADWVFYLPLDSAANARQFLDIVNPRIVFFIKYEFWHHYLTQLKERNIPVFLVSGIFRPSQPFFKSYGSFHRNMLTCFHHLFVQDEASKNLLDTILPNEKSSVSGDTRFDRVVEIAVQAKPVNEIESWIKNKKIIVAGSTWEPDEKILKEILSEKPGFSLILCPHVVSTDHINNLQKLFPEAVLYSGLQKNETTSPDAKVLIIDTIGLLSRLYQYAWVCYIGGGFGKGIHNTLEAAVYYKPVLFGPVFQKFKEACDLISVHGAFSITNKESLSSILNQLSLEDFYHRSAHASGEFVRKNKGATESILTYLQENRLLTSLSN